MLLFAGVWLFRTPAPPVELNLPRATSPVINVAPDSVTVHVVGAVNRPGVYKVADGARLFEVVYAAGGFAATADQAGVNLAAVVADGEQVYVPARGEVAPTAGAPTAGGVRSGKVNINRATETELESLPGIGPSTANAIITYRKEHGSFGSIEDLLRVTGIGDAKLDAIRELISL